MTHSFSYLEPMCSMSGSNCCFLTCIQISLYAENEAGQMIWYPHLFQNFPQFIVINSVKSFGIVNTEEINVFWNSLAFLMTLLMLAFSSAFSKISLNTWKFSVHILLKPGLENFEHYFTSVWDECNCVVVWAFFSIAFPWGWNENCSFPVLWLLLIFPNLLAYRVQHFHSIIF